MRNYYSVDIIGPNGPHHETIGATDDQHLLKILSHLFEGSTFENIKCIGRI